MQEKKNLDTSLMKFIEPSQGIRDSFISGEIIDNVGIELRNFRFFFDLIDLDEKTQNELYFVLNEAQRLPAALGGYHGGYTGGLFDHTLLVVNYTNYLCNSLRVVPWHGKALLTAICHDFGKVSYYGFKLNVENRKIEIAKDEAEKIRFELHSKFGLTGEDRHVENGIAVIRKYLSHYKTLFDDEMYLAIVFHHGSWSKYRPQRMNTMASLIHVADMFASQVLGI